MNRHDPGEERRNPSLRSPTYAVRAPLADWLGAEAARAAQDYGRFRLLDVGCGGKPYEPLFAAFVGEYVGVDVDNPAAELEGSVESLPVEDGSFQVVLCTQVLEHAGDPTRAVAELSRVTAPEGRVLASTHGVQAYHPNPDDYWRWTHTGLQRLFEQHGEWRSVIVKPGSGTAACVAMVLALYGDLLFRKRLHLGFASEWFSSLLNRAGRGLDARSALLREPGPGTLFANYHVVAQKP
jgi:SAM-dependent methyltransferase